MIPNLAISIYIYNYVNNQYLREHTMRKRAPNKCVICDHPNVKEINEEIESLSLQHLTPLTIFEKMDIYKFTKATFYRHLKSHIYAGTVTEGSAVKNVKEIVANLDRALDSKPYTGIIDKLDLSGKPLKVADMATNIQYLFDKAVCVIERAERSGEDDLVLRGVREARSCSEIVIKASELFLVHKKRADFDSVITSVVTALEQYPEAKKAVANVLEEKHVE